MSQKKEWKEMLAELQADLAAAHKNRQADDEVAQIWVGRLQDVFNSKAVNRLIPLRLTKKSRKEHGQTVEQGIALCSEIMEKIVKKEFNAHQLSCIFANARDITSMDFMNGLLLSLSHAAYAAYELTEDETNAQRDAWYEAINQKEYDVFYHYLDQNPQVVPVLQALMKNGGSLVTAEDVSEQLGHTITKGELQSIAAGINSILGNIHNMRPFVVMKHVNEAFRDWPDTDLQEEHYSYHFGMGGREEVRNLVKNGPRHGATGIEM